MIIIPSTPPRTLSALAHAHDTMQEIPIGPDSPLSAIFKYTHSRFPPFLSAYDPGLFEPAAAPGTMTYAFDFLRVKLLDLEAFGAQIKELAAREELEVSVSLDTAEKLGDRQSLTLSCHGQTYQHRKRFESFSRGLYLVLHSPTADRCAPAYKNDMGL